MSDPTPFVTEYDVNGKRYTEIDIAEWAARKWAGAARGDVFWVDATTIQDQANRKKVMMLVAVDPGSPSER